MAYPTLPASSSEPLDLEDVKALLESGGDLARALEDCPGQDVGFPSAGPIGRGRPIWTAPAGHVHRWARLAHGRTRMIVLPLIRLVGLKAATASSRVETLPMFVRSRPSRTRPTMSFSWA